MWLSYLEYFVDEILNVIDRNPAADLESEFPTKWDYLLYLIFSCCENWCGAVRNLELSQEKAKNRHVYPEYCACTSMGRLLRKILISRKTTERQKRYFLEITLRLMRELDHAKLSLYSSVIFNSCVRECDHSKIDLEAVNLLRSVYGQVDHVLKNAESTFEINLNKI